MLRRALSRRNCLRERTPRESSWGARHNPAPLSRPINYDNLARLIDLRRRVRRRKGANHAIR